VAASDVVSEMAAPSRSVRDRFVKLDREPGSVPHLCPLAPFMLNCPGNC
jgi:hypothetical protein